MWTEVEFKYKNESRIMYVQILPKIGEKFNL